MPIKVLAAAFPVQLVASGLGTEGGWPRPWAPASMRKACEKLLAHLGSDPADVRPASPPLPKSAFQVKRKINLNSYLY